MDQTVEKPNVALIGCGKMGGALLRGWVHAHAAGVISVLEPGEIPPLVSDTAYTHHKKLEDVPPSAVYVLAVKPQDMDTVCAALAPAVPDGALIISIAAGRTIASFENHFGKGRGIVRAMPNLPAAVGKGMTALAANLAASTEQKAAADSLLRAVGKTAWVDDERLMDAVTALSGSGPAYVFLLIEMLTEAGRKTGLPSDLAATLARQTVIGSATLAETAAQTPADTLRKNVTSPGGTTESALKILMDHGDMQTLFDRALAAAVRRGKELAK